jgi:tetratricopeptide (TPR) repeat protein
MPTVIRMSCVVIVLVLVGAPRVADAGDPAIRKPKAVAALDHLARATKLYNVRSFEEAAREYKAGALVEAAPVFDYNLGQCYRQLGRYKEAIWHYERFIKTSPETPERNESVTGFIAQMRAELENRAMTAPPTEPAASAAVPTVPPIAAAPAVGSPAPEPWYADGVGWGLAAGGVIALGGSAALLVSAAGLDDDANHTSMQRASDELHDRAYTRSLAGAALGIGGVALLATGIVKLVVTPTARTETAGVAIAPGGVSVFGRF